MIPALIFQTSPCKPLNDDLKLKLESALGEKWIYLHFDDSEIIKFFRNNPLDAFPDIEAKFHSFQNGAHKADLFRYYFLFYNGGVFLDYDAMIYQNIDAICENYNFFSVHSTVIQGSLFQGFIGSSPQNPIIYEALHKAYYTENSALQQDYHLFCKQIFDIHQNSTESFLFEEGYYDDDTFKVFDKNETIIALHFWRHKIIP
jgi:mannosyltransferase OCH1-like enzyme